MGKEVSNYSGADVTIVFAGITISGVADGTFVKVVRDNPMFTSTTGADGEGARAKSSDASGTVTVTLLQTSNSNDALSAQAALDEANGSGMGALMVKDGSGRSIAHAEKAWIERYSDLELGREIGNREWVFKSTNLELFVAGN